MPAMIPFRKNYFCRITRRTGDFGGFWTVCPVLPLRRQVALDKMSVAPFLSVSLRKNHRKSQYFHANRPRPLYRRAFFCLPAPRCGGTLHFVSRGGTTIETPDFAMQLP